MENFPSYSYPDSGDSSPRSREIDFENPPPSWEDQQQQQQPQPSLNHKVKFMVSYGGRIQPRSHDNLLAYVGGETKILAVDRSIKFSSLHSKLSSILSSDSAVNDAVSGGFIFKYQLPGEELDALISVTNDDDLENMMHEYDRLYRGSTKPARLRIFLFPVHKSGSFGSTSSDPGKIDRESDRFVEALNSGPSPPPPPAQVNSNMDFLFGLDKGPGQGPIPALPVQPPVQVPVPVQRHEPDPQIDARIQEMNRMQISVQEMNRQKSEEANYATSAPANVPASVQQIPAGYWQPPPPPQQVNVEQPPQQPMPPQHHQQQFHHQPQQQHQQQQHQQFHPQQQQQHQQHQQHQQQQPVYMVHAPPPGNVYHAPMMRPVAGQPGQGYYQMQRVPSDQVYREQQVYNMGSGKMGGYSDGMGLPARPVAGMAPENQGYTQVAYDNGSGRQVYYAAPPGSAGVVTAPFQGVSVNGSGEMRPVTGPAGLTSVPAEGNKGIQKVVSNSNV